MFVSKSSLVVVLFSLSTVTAFASTAIIPSINYPVQPQEISTQTKPNIEIKDCNNSDKDCNVLHTQQTTK